MKEIDAYSARVFAEHSNAGHGRREATEIDKALSELITVAAELVRGEGLPSGDEDNPPRVSRARAGKIQSEAVRRGVRIRDAVNVIRRAMKGGA